MFYCVYFFSPFHLKPIRVWLFSRVGGFVWNLWLPQTAQRQQTLRVLYSAFLFSSSGMFFFPFPDSFSLPLWWIPTCRSRPSSNIIVGGKHLLSPPPSSRQSWFFPGLFIPASYGSCHLSIVGCYVCDDLCSLGSFGVPDHVFLVSESPILCRILNDGLLLSLEVNHNGRKICLRWVCC